MEKIKRSAGFTVVELMISVALSTFIIGGVFIILHVGSEQSRISEVRMTLQESAREGLFKMVQEIRQSAPTRITIAAGGNSIQFSIPDPAALVTTAYAVNWTGAHTIRYAIGGASNRQLLRTDATTNQTSVIVNDVTGILFVGNATDPNVVTITLSVQRTALGGQPIPATPLQITAQAEVRNS